MRVLSLLFIAVKCSLGVFSYKIYDALKLHSSFFCISRPVFKMGTITPPFDTRWHCKWFHLVFIYFTIPKHQFYEYSCKRSAVKEWNCSFVGTLYMRISLTYAFFMLLYIQQLNYMF